jgi:hypothetical protein
MYLLGQLEHGVYVESDDELDGIPPHEISDLYGVEDVEWEQSDNSLFGVSDTAIVDMIEQGLQHHEVPEDLGEGLVERIQQQLKHTPVTVPRIQNPFTDHHEIEVVFWQALAQATEEVILPHGHGFLEGEAGYEEWVPVEHVAVGKRVRGKFQKITLPQEMWEPRAKVWVQGLEGMMHLVNE